jgi:hypothetical protein
VRLRSAVLNSPDVEGCERFAVEKLGFKVSDRTGHMRFVRCNRKHHALAYAKSDYKVGSPDDWKWPPGRIDHWGVSKKDVARTSAAEKVLRFRA